VHPRSLGSPDFANDDGSADAGLVAALAAYGEDAGRLPQVLAALHTARVLTPVVATSLASGAGTGDGGAAVAVPLLEGVDGRRALPVFTSVAAMAAWDARARPVPVNGRVAAAVARAEGAEVLVLDIAGPTTCVLDDLDLEALIDGRYAG
jgi:hypothetical protein